MRSLSRIVLAIVAVVALVAGITFVKLYQVSPSEEPVRTSSPDRTAKAMEVRLNFLNPVWEWNPPEDGQFEQHSKGSKDFWFKNDNPVPVELGMKSKSCKCSDVSVAVLPPSEIGRYGNADTAELRTEPLVIDDYKGVTVAPGGGGVIRLAWEDKKEKESQERPERLVVEIWAQAPGGGPRSVTKLELPIALVPALRVNETILKVPDLSVNGKETKEFKCWSSTRDAFSLTAKEQTGNPCFSCTCTPLSESARKELAAATKSHVKSGYAVRVTVSERVNDKEQMELGPFVRRIQLTGKMDGKDSDIEQATVVITGIVRGDITVESEDERGGIALGYFPAKRGMTKTVKLSSHRPGLKLEDPKVEPEDSSRLKVKSFQQLDTSTTGGRTKWELCVEVPPGSSGRLPDHSAVVLTIKGDQERRIRIPVTGFATQ